MQKVMPGVSGMNTDSISRPASSSSKNLMVPSADVSFCLTVGVEMTNAWSRLSRRDRDRSVMGPNSVTARRYTHR